MEARVQGSVARWRAAALIAIGVAIGVSIGAGPATPIALWSSHRLKAHPTKTAYAFVRSMGEPELVTTRSRGFSSIRRIGQGLYCLVPAGVDLSARAAVATPEWTYTSGLDRNIAVFVDYGTPLCAHAELAVETTPFGRPGRRNRLHRRRGIGGRNR